MCVVLFLYNACYHKPVRRYRTRYGEGVALYTGISARLSFLVRNDLNCFYIEILLVEIKSHNQKFLVGIIYRPPYS